jgi:hypothetical protein
MRHSSHGQRTIHAMDTRNARPVLRLTAQDAEENAILVQGIGPSRIAPVHIQLHPSGAMRLMMGQVPRMWMRPTEGYYECDVVIAEGPSPLRLAPLTEKRNPSASWTRTFAELLREESSPSPFRGGDVTATIHRSRDHNHSPNSCVWMLREMQEAVDEGYYPWDRVYTNLLPTRVLSPANDGRVRFFRKLARKKTLPPVLAMWCSGLATHLVLDGHDRLHAALLENVMPEVITIQESRPKEPLDVWTARQAKQAEILLRVPPTSPEHEARIRMYASEVWTNPRPTSEAKSPSHPMRIRFDAWQQEVRLACRTRGVEVPPEMLRPA